MNFNTIINYGDQNYRINFEEQGASNETTYQIEGHHYKIGVTSSIGNPLPIDVDQRLQGLKQKPVLLKEIYAVVLGVDQSVLSQIKLLETVDAVKKLAAEQLAKVETENIETFLSHLDVFQSEIEQNIQSTVKKHDEVVLKLNDLGKHQWNVRDSRNQALEVAVNLISSPFKSLQKSKLEVSLKSYKLELIENLYKQFQLEVVKSPEEAKKVQPRLDLALEQAICIEHLGYVKELHHAGGKFKEEHLFLALGLQSRRIMDLLYHEGLDINKAVIKPFNWTMLHFACANIDKPVDSIKFLLDYQADPAQKDEDGLTPLHLAFENNLPIEILEQLLSHTKNLDLMDNRGRSLLVSAIEGQKTNDPGLLKLLLDKGVEPNTKDVLGGTPVCAAIRTLGFKAVPALQALMNAGAAITTRNDFGETPLHEAALQSCVHSSSETDDGSVTRFLLQSGASPLVTDIHEQTPLHHAVRVGVYPKNEKTLKALLDAGADINAQDDQGNTALHYAAGLGHIDQVKFLLSKGADRTIRNKLGETPAGKAKIGGILWKHDARQIIDLLGKVQNK